jgi:hypothetical protein
MGERRHEVEFSAIDEPRLRKIDRVLQRAH